MTLAFKNTPMSKKEAIEKAVAHRLADEFTQGQWREDGKGCSLGCMFHDVTDHNWFETAADQTGIPLEIVHLQERIFEGLPIAKAKHWTERFYRAVPEGVDLSSVTPKFLLWLLIDEKHGVLHLTEDGWDQRRAISTIAELLRRKIDGDNPEPEEWAAARTAAWAAEVAAWVAARTAAEVAARAAWAAAEAAAWAAWAAAWAVDAAAGAAEAAAWAAEAAAEVAAWEAMADKLIELLEKNNDRS